MPGMNTFQEQQIPPGNAKIPSGFAAKNLFPSKTVAGPMPQSQGVLRKGESYVIERYCTFIDEL